MHSMTLEQLRATANAGGVTSVTLKGKGGGFFVTYPGDESMTAQSSTFPGASAVAVMEAR
jgi:hypothetical protein